MDNEEIKNMKKTYFIPDDKWVAIKIYKNYNFSLIFKELIIMQEFKNSKYIINLICVTKIDNMSGIVMDLCACDLFDFIKFTYLTISDKVNILLQIIKTINKLHLKNVAHFDIKLENFLIENKNNLRILLCDFGLSKMVPTFEQLGTYGYMAPEIMNENKKLLSLLIFIHLNV